MQPKRWEKTLRNLWTYNGGHADASVYVRLHDGLYEVCMTSKHTTKELSAVFADRRPRRWKTLTGAKSYAERIAWAPNWLRLAGIEVEELEAATNLTASQCGRRGL